MKEENFDSVTADVDSAAGINSENILSEIESVLVKEKLEPLYQSISQLKNLLIQLRDRAELDIRNIGESIPDEDPYSAYSSVIDSYLSSDAGVNAGFYPDGNDADVGGYFAKDVLEVHKGGSQIHPAVNRTGSDLRSKAVESAMTDFHEQEMDTKQNGRRFKRDLGWGRGSRLYSPYDTPDDDEASFVSSVYEEDADGRSSSLFETGDSPDDDRNRQLMALFARLLRSPAKDERKAMKHFFELVHTLTDHQPGFHRKRRNKESFETFVETMPTLEGMRKRTSTIMMSNFFTFKSNFS